jgi:pilus assembly protein Flp/PilA
MENAIRRLQNFFRREDGPTAVEYAVMVGLIAVVCLAGVRRIGNKSKTTFRNVSKSVGS